jgi:serine O-acetyltransferase
VKSYPFASLRADLADDLETYLDFSAQYAVHRRTFAKRLSALLSPSGLACLFYRVSHWAHSRGMRRFSAAAAWCNLLITRTSISPASRIGGGLYIPHPSTGIVFQGTAGRNLRLFAGCAVAARQTPLHFGELTGTPTLGDNVSVGAKAFVTGAITVGDGARIGFNALVDRDVPPGALVVSAHVRNRGRPLKRPPVSG